MAGGGGAPTWADTPLAKISTYKAMIAGRASRTAKLDRFMTLQPCLSSSDENVDEIKVVWASAALLSWKLAQVSADHEVSRSVS